MRVLAALIAPRLLRNRNLRVFRSVGKLGGLTSVFAFALDFALLAKSRDSLAGRFNAAGPVALSLARIFLGIWVSKALPA
jgi:fluoride ion exporter CrcB/FEX